MNYKHATHLCRIGIAIGAFAIVMGVIPFAIGLHALSINNMHITQESVANLKSTPGGDTLANCALASVALANQGATAYNSLAHISRSQSLMLLIGGAAVSIIFALLLRFMSQVVKVSA